MTQLLQRAFAEAQKLPDADQDAIAEMILAELADELRWDETFANSQDQLERMADKAMDDIRAGRNARNGDRRTLNSRLTEDFIALFARLPDAVKEQARKAYRLWRHDPTHRSLHFKRVHSHRPIYSARVSLNWRVLGLLHDGTMYWFWIGSHANYDRVLHQL